MQKASRSIFLIDRPCLTCASCAAILTFTMIQADDTPQYCARHPKVQTSLACAACAKPICPDCLVQTPVGMKCRACAAGNSGTLFKPSPLQMAAGAAVGLAAGAVAGWAVDFPVLGFFTLFLAFIYGGFAGDMILRASSRKRGIRMEILAGAAMALGAIAGRMAVAASVLADGKNAAPPLGVLHVLVELVQSPLSLICLVVAIGAAVSRIRYIS